MTDPRWLSLRAYARHRGVTLRAVQRALECGRITREPCEKIDPKRADRQWAENTRYRPTGADVLQFGKNGEPVNIAAAKLVQERYAALRAKRRYENLRASLVEVAAVRTAVAKLSGQAVARLRRVPAELAPLLAGRNDLAEVREIAERELRRVCVELAAGGRSHGPGRDVDIEGRE